MYKTPTNKEIAALLHAIADALEIKAADEFRVRAFRNGARSVEVMEVDVADAVSQGRLDILPGIGKTLGGVIDEFVRTAASGELEKAREGIPPGVFGLLELRGLGPKTAGKFLKELQIADVDGLEQAALSGRLRTLPGMGPKKEESLLTEIGKHRARRGRRLLAEALAAASQLVAELSTIEGVAAAAIAGAVRRRAPVVEAIELLVATLVPELVFEQFARLCEGAVVEGRRASGRTSEGIPVTLTVCVPEVYGAQLLLATGSNAHVERIRSLAAERGVPIDGAAGGGGLGDEQRVYAKLGLPFVPPELREDGAEVDSALRGDLPRLLELADLRGDLHCHTRWSDGAHSIAEMARAAQAVGRDYLAISDHSASLTVAHGLEPQRLVEQAEAIAEANREVGQIEILRGTEVDILADGTLDYGDDLLAGLDWVSAAVHSSFRQPAEKMTQRIVAAIRNPNVDSIAHPTGRLLNSRDGYEFDVDVVFAAAAAMGTALEINAQPDRLDLPDELARKAAAMGIPIVINTDAHHTDQLGLLTFGASAGRRAWLTSAGVVNARGLDGLRAWRAERRRIAARS